MLQGPTLMAHLLYVNIFQIRFLSNTRGRNARDFPWSFQSAIDPNTQILHNTSCVFRIHT